MEFCDIDNIQLTKSAHKTLDKHFNKEDLVVTIENLVSELNNIINELAKSAKISTQMHNINALLYHSLVMLVDELEYIRSYINKIESTIDISVFDTAKKLNDSIVNLIGHRKDIMFKILETSCKIHEYIIKWKKLAVDVSLGEDDSQVD